MKHLLSGAAFLGAILAPITFAAEPAKPKPEIAPEADALLKQVGEFHRGLKSARAELSVDILQDIPGIPKTEQDMKGTLSLQRPNFLALRVTDGKDGSEQVAIVADGKTVWAHIPELKQFTVDDAPAALDDLLRDSQSVRMFAGQLGPATDLFRNQPREAILSGVTLLKVVGTEKIAGADCTRLHGEQEDMDWDAWFQNGAQPALRKFVFSPLKGMKASAPEEIREKLKDAKLDVTVNYTWQFDTPLPEKTFAFEPPKEAKKVAQFGPPDDEDAEAGADPASALQGKPAPDFSLDLLAGGKMQLAQHKGKDVVVLDFWATWCGPCVRALPGLGEIATAYKDKGVAVYAVNQQEEAGVVKKFLEAKKLALPVPMDAKGEVAKLYQVRGIPQTVVIDKAGNVAAVHVGFSPGLKETLTKEIDAALAK